MGSTEIAGDLRQMIASGAYAQRERLPAERALAHHYDAARGTVRQAINELAAEGLVDIRAGSGTYVKAIPDMSGTGPIEHASPLELIDARFALEPHICRLSVLRARREDFVRAERLLGIMDDSVGDRAVFSRADMRFHTLLARTTGNELLVWMIEQINGVRAQEQWSRMRYMTLDQKMIEIYNRQHRMIFEEICVREPERAAVAMKDHLETARLSLTRAAST